MDVSHFPISSFGEECVRLCASGTYKIKLLQMSLSARSMHLPLESLQVPQSFREVRVDLCQVLGGCNLGPVVAVAW